MRRFLRSMAWMAAGLACTLPAHGSSLRQLRESAEASMLVTGSLIVNPDGSLRSYRIDDAAKLPQAVLGLISKNAAGWHFRPVLQDGRAVAAEAKMSLRIVARPEPDERYELSIRGAQFGRDVHRAISADHRVPPWYPMNARFARAGADVYLALQVDRTGKVVDAAVTQVNLTAVGNDRLMAEMRKSFAASSVDAGKRWTFKIAQGAVPPPDGYWVVRVPIAFRISRSESRGPAWHAYIPGPLQYVPWLQHDNLAGNDVDAMPANGVYDPRNALTLLTGLNRG
ncbi:energy transducer TonB [Fulvimonas sp. R45]|uniref:energy transducer TonB n=1 Tax=Fulvimonas sp. R45 TaxID=3045937 RepID=UPI00265E4D80|nr:energy transducer TonB [Fulvimonas sp. R45]MDO1529220.1 energy transducer TonB [Fulvimonas sp. R45]